MDITLIYVPYDLDEYRVGMGLAPEALKRLHWENACKPRKFGKRAPTNTG
jgi:arginase family enzyme